MTDDPELLRQYLEHSSEAAFAELVRRHVDFVYGVALRHAGGAHRAEDIVQLVFIDLARKAGTLSRRTELVGWLYTSTRYAAAKVVRAEVRRETREHEAHMNQQALGNAREADWRQLQPVLDEALQGLGESDRSAVLLRFFKNLSFAEIGESWRVSEEAARKRVDRALEKLRGQLARRGITSTSAALADALGRQISPLAPATLAGAATTAALLARNAVSHAPLFLKLLHLMSTSKAVATAAVIAGLLSLTATLREFDQMHRSTNDLAALRASANGSLTELQNERKALARAQSEQATLAQALKAVSPAPAKVAPTPPSPVVQVDDPKMQAAARALIRSFNRESYGPFFASQHWTPEQIDAFLNALTEHNSALGQGNVQIGSDDQPATDAAVRAVVGDAYPQLQAFQNRFQYEGLVQKLAGNLYATDPLSREAAEQLVQQWEGNNIIYHHTAAGSDNWQGLLEKAQGILTPAQLATLGLMGTAATGQSYSLPSPPASGP